VGFGKPELEPGTNDLTS